MKPLKGSKVTFWMNCAFPLSKGMSKRMECLLKSYCWKKATYSNFSLHVRSSHRRCSVRKGVLKNFAKFTGKQLYQSLFLNKVAGLKPVFGQFWGVIFILKGIMTFLNKNINFKGERKKFLKNCKLISCAIIFG